MKKENLQEGNETRVAAQKMPLKVRLRPYFITLPALIVTIGILIPFFTAIFLSFTNYSFKSRTFSFVWFSNWIQMFKSPDFWHAIWVTLRYAFFACGSEILVGMLLGWLLSSLNSRYSRALRVLFVFPLMIAPVIGTIIWQLMINNSVGVLEKFLNVFGVYGFPWAASHKTAMFTAVLIDFWINSPFCILLILAGFQSLPQAPYEAAMIDGGSAWFTFRKLTLPLLKPSLIIAILFRVIGALEEETIIFTLTKGGPGNTLMNISSTAFTLGYTYQNLGKAIPYILIMYIFIFMLASNLVKAWNKAQRIAAGNELN